MEEITYCQEDNSFLIFLNKEDLDKSRELAKKFSKYKEWSGTAWGKGGINTKDKQYLAEIIGMIHEVAFSKLSSLPIDEEVKINGNSYDFIISNNIKLDVKGMLRYPGIECYIRHTNDNGKMLDFKSNIYLFGHLESPDVDVISSTGLYIRFIGWKTDKEIEKKHIVKQARKGYHTNKCFLTHELHNMKEFSYKFGYGKEFIGGIIV